jgi:hypothetical protein
MMPEGEDLSRSRAISTGIKSIAGVADATVGTMGLITRLADHLFSIRDEIARRRCKQFVSLVLRSEAATEEHQKSIASDLRNEHLCLETFQKIFEDEEAEKTWAFASLFRAFTMSRIPKEERLRYLRLIREITVADLGMITCWDVRVNEIQSEIRAKLPVGAPTTIDPEDSGSGRAHERVESEYPNLVQALVRWGFFLRRDGTRAPGPIQNARGGDFALLVEILRDGDPALPANQFLKDIISGV